MGMRQRVNAVENNVQRLAECFLLEARKPKLNTLENKSLLQYTLHQGRSHWCHGGDSLSLAPAASGDGEDPCWPAGHEE